MGVDWVQLGVAGIAGALLSAGVCWKLWRSKAASARRVERGELKTLEECEVGSPGWHEGADLMRYPDHLARLERRLEQSCQEAEDQVRHLKRQRDRLEAKEDGEGLSVRYEEDATHLEHRQAQLERVLGLVWRTRCILILRVRVAVVARSCPRLSELPQLPDMEADWEGVADGFRMFRGRVRKAMRIIRIASSDLALTLPSSPSRADLQDAEREPVQAELERARQTLVMIEGRMDRLKDTVAYLADRCRTREVVEAAPLVISTDEDAEELFHDVSQALGELDALSDLVDQRLAEDAMDNLAAGITQLEREGLDAQAESDAAMEVDRLLEQFPS